jgi:ABC-type transport system involved in multi-copper enzyme maturation permease subunit
MTWNQRCVRANVRKELREYRRNANIIYATAILPLLFMIQPLIHVFALPTSASVSLRHEHTLLYILAIPVLVPEVLAAYSVVGERLQGTLEPVLGTPIRREELLLGKALAAFVPSVAVAYGDFALFVAVVEIFARPQVASALIRAPELVAQLLFTPLLAAWSIWVGIAVSARASDPRTAAQLSMLMSLPTVAVTTLVALNVIPATFGVAIALGTALLLVVGLGWWFASAIFDRERLVTSTK